MDFQTAIYRTDLSRLQRGSALLSAMLILALMTVLAVGSLRTVMADRQVAGFQKRARTALYAGEAGVAVAGAVLRATPPTASDGIGGLIAYAPTFPDSATPQYLGAGPNPPRFYADPNPPSHVLPHPGIKYIGAGQKCWDGNQDGLMSEEAGGAGKTIWRDALFDIRVMGETTDGTDSLVQALVTNCHPFSS